MLRPRPGKLGLGECRILRPFFVNYWIALEVEDGHNRSCCQYVIFLCFFFLGQLSLAKLLMSTYTVNQLKGLSDLAWDLPTLLSLIMESLVPL